SQALALARPKACRRMRVNSYRWVSLRCTHPTLLGRWESLEMVQRYTRSVTFEDSMKHYKAPLS
ncbi:MAG: hypothetical protein WBC89_06180, partial [Dehalococcoidia bacterium]